MDNNQQTLNNSSESTAAPVQEQQKTPQSVSEGGVATEAQKITQQGESNHAKDAKDLVDPSLRLTKQDYLKILLPTKREAWIVVILVAIVFVVYEANLIFLKATNNTIFSSSGLSESVNNQIDAFLGNNLIANKASLIIFWAGVGLVAYSIIWSIYSFISESKNEVVVAKEYVNQASKKERMTRSLTQAGALAGIIALGLLGVNITVPYLVGLWTQGIGYIPGTTGEIVNGLLLIAGGFIGLCANFYLFKVLIDWIVALE